MWPYVLVEIANIYTKVGSGIPMPDDSWLN